MTDLTQISHYRILEKLGAGGMGEVYLAEDLKLGRKVAIKILGEEYTTNRDRLSRFEQEASAASALNHPNILTIYEVGDDGGRHFIATEFVDGATLRRKLSAHSLDTGEALDISVQVASALEEAHAAGIVHRDIKPDNIMIRRNGYVKLLDFGLAKLTERSIDHTASDGEASTRVLVQTDAGVVMGTSHYMSPEQARGKPVDARSDIWSLGVVMYEMVTGRTPFEGETSTDVIVAITQKEPAPIARYAPNVPAELEWIIMKALRKARDERYQTIKELLTDLRRLKQKREFEVELERSVSPDSLSRSGFPPVPGTPTVTDRVLPTAEKTVSHMSSAEYLVSGIRRHKIVAIAGGGILVVGLVAALFVYLNRPHALTDKDTILLTDFINTTGETVFDGTLKQALSVQLGQSPFLNIFPEERVREALKYMGKPPDERVTREIGREICQRQGIKALLVGSISSLGSQYVITLEAITQSGESLAREQAQAESKEKVLSALGAAASSLRQKLGESLSSIKKYDVAVEQATTSSLEALKAFTTANEERAKGRTRESLAFYQRAVELDPNFAMAYARIGVHYGNRGQIELAKQFVQKAYDLRNRVSERERLYITEKYYNYIEGDILKAIETQQTWSRLYPNDYIPHNNLALNYQYLGRYEEARKEAQEAVRLAPNNTSSQENLSGAFLGLGRFEESERVANELLASNPDFGGTHFYRYLYAFLRGDQGTMDAENQWSRQKTEDEADMLPTIAATSFYFGQLKKGEEETRKAVSLLTTLDRKENAAGALIGLASTQALVGKCQEAKANARSGLALARGRVQLIGSALILAGCNDLSQAQSILDEAVKQFPNDTPTAVMGAPLIRALMEKSKGKPEEALRLLETIRAYDFGLIQGVANNYARAEVYLALKNGRQAADEFQAIIDRRGVDVFSAARPLSYLGLARAAKLGGDTARSRKAYQDFFALWKNADADLPVLIEARKEYESLTSE